MSQDHPPDRRSRAGQAQLRRSLILIALISWGLGTLHLIDHVVRGELVVSRGLEPTWNHSGWPFQPSVTPFTVSAVLVPLLLLGGVLLTLRGRAWAGYWLASGIILGAIVIVVHFVPGPQTETPGVIFGTYTSGLPTAAGTVLGIVALAVVVAVIGAVILLIRTALRAHKVSGRW